MALTQSRPHSPPLPPLRPGERLGRPEFHARYEAMPPGTKAELIGGTVHVMPSPVSREHARHHWLVIKWLSIFEDASPGVEGLDNPTLMLGGDSECQPDACLCVTAERGGRTRVEDGYVYGAPELVVEVAISSRLYDLGTKKMACERAGVDEYVVILPEERGVRWFCLQSGHFQALAQDSDGLLRSRRFPGLWLDAGALPGVDFARIRSAAERGLASAEHGHWVRKMGGG